MRFEIDRAGVDEPFIFHLLDDGGRKLLVGRACATQEECLDVMRETIDRLDVAASVAVEEQAGSFFSVLRDAGGGELARSEPLASGQAAQELSASIVEAAAEMTRYEATFTTRAAAQAASAISLQRVGGELSVAELYDFGRASTSGQGGFEEFERDDGSYAFHFNDADGRVLLYGRSFASAGDRARRIRAVIRSAAREARFERREEAGVWYFVLTSRNGREIGRSRSFASVADMEAAIAYLMETAPEFEGRYAAARRSTERRDKYDLARASITGMAGFETFRADDGLHYFHFNDDSGRAILFSQGYASAGSRDNGIRSVIKNAAIAERYEEAQDESGRYFVLKAANNAEIGRSPSFADATELAAALAFLQATASSYAAAWGVQLDTSPATRRETFTLDVEREPEPPPGPPLPYPTTEPEPEFEAEPEPPPGPPPPHPADEPEPEAGGRSWWLWVLLLLLLIALLLLALRSCRGTAVEPDVAVGEPPTAPAARAEPPAPAPPAASEEPVQAGEGEGGAPPAEPLGPDGSALGLPPGTMAWRIAGFLSDPESRFPHTFTMDRVRYPENSPVLNREGYDDVDELVEVLRAYPGTRIELLGHIDGTESEVYEGRFQDGDITLSAIRARCIYKKLLERGIAAERVSFRGAAASQPVSADDTEQGRQRNRRQEIILLRR